MSGLELTGMLDQRYIRLRLEATKKHLVIRELVALLHEAGKINQPEKIEAAILKRERLVSTGIGSGIAIPHLLTSEVAQTVMALGRRQDGINFRSLDGIPVYLIFLIVGPKNEEYRHLQLLSRLSRFLHDEEFRRCLMDADSEQEVMNTFRQKEESEP